jgi:hypothetical protein
MILERHPDKAAFTPKQSHKLYWISPFTNGDTHMCKGVVVINGAFQGALKHGLLRGC